MPSRSSRKKVPGSVTTFYSFKGGVGRTFILANVAWLLARWGRRVLCLDWDLEAPGLHRYLSPEVSSRRGILDMLRALGSGDEFDWHKSTIQIAGPWQDQGRLDLIDAGQPEPKYFDRLQELNWTSYFEAGLSERLERLRTEWVSEYDHVFLDARTGVTDIGGICAAQLPDMLVTVLTTTLQSIEGTVEIVRRATETRARLPLDRGGFRSLPIVARVHSGEEALLEQEWLGRIERQLEPLYRRWLDSRLNIAQLLPFLRVREYARWSFGEHLPVREERLDDPLLVSWALANIAALVDCQLVEMKELVESRDQYLLKLATGGLGAPLGEERQKPIDVFISHASSDTEPALELYHRLIREGLSVYMDVTNLAPGEPITETLYRARENARLIVILLSERSQQSPGLMAELTHVERMAKEQTTLVVPIFLDRKGLATATQELQNRFGLFHEPGDSWDSVVTQIVRTSIRTRSKDLTREEVQAVLGRHGGDEMKAATELGVAVTVLVNRMRVLGLA